MHGESSYGNLLAVWKNKVVTSYWHIVFGLLWALEVHGDCCTLLLLVWMALPCCIYSSLQVLQSCCWSAPWLVFPWFAIGAFGLFNIVVSFGDEIYVMVLSSGIAMVLHALVMLNSHRSPWHFFFVFPFPPPHVFLPQQYWSSINSITHSLYPHLPHILIIKMGQDTPFFIISHLFSGIVLVY